MRSTFVSSLAFVFPVCLLMTGCSALSRDVGSSSGAVAQQSGRVHGGQQPVNGATVQLYAVGTSGDGSAPTPLLSPALHSDANGGFDLTGHYTCPDPSVLVYLVATGGNPGLGAGTTNAALSMMTAIGTCQTLMNTPIIQVNEVTTVAAAVALAPFTTAPNSIGSNASDAAALSAAFTEANQFVDIGGGASPGPGQSATATYYGPGVPVATIYTLANILAACVNSPGGTASDTSTACGKLFSLTGSPTDTLSAIVALEKDPAAYDTASLYALATGAGPFQPQLGTPPSDFGVALIVPTGGTPQVVPIPTTVYEGSTLWVASTTADCLYYYPSIIQINNYYYATGGVAGCGRISGNIPTGLGYGIVMGRVFTSTGGQTYNVNYPFYINIVPKPDQTISVSPTTFYWIGTVGVQDYTQDVTVKNSTTGTLTLSTPVITGTNASAFSIVSTNCPATLGNTASCTITLSFKPPVTTLVSASMVITANNGAYSATAVLAGTGLN